MRIVHCILIVLLTLLVAILWMAITQQSVLLDSRRIPEERLNELLCVSRRNGRRLADMARQNEVLTSRTQAILERVTPTSAPAKTPTIITTPPLTPYRGPDEPLVLYEAEPAKTPGRKGGDQ